MQTMVTLESFTADRHAATYVPELDADPNATTRLLALLNDPQNEQRLIHAEELQRPALAGVVRLLEDEPAIAAVLETGAAGYRFRQAVGVAIKLKMEELGGRRLVRRALSRMRTTSRRPNATPADLAEEISAHGRGGHLADVVGSHRSNASQSYATLPPLH